MRSLTAYTFLALFIILAITSLIWYGLIYAFNSLYQTYTSINFVSNYMNYTYVTTYVSVYPQQYALSQYLILLYPVIVLVLSIVFIIADKNFGGR